MNGAAPAEAVPTHLFVYGTLRPGEVRWHHLEPYVVAEVVAVDTATAGELYDTELDYPAAMFGGADRILGRVYELRADRMAEGLAHLDEVESAVRGDYRRVVITTESGHTAWAYQCGEEALLVRRITSGDWLLR
ncbi:MAG: gamma-glutamylcyclotransferase family protein [Ilumatobacteraceae bacterium]